MWGIFLGIEKPMAFITAVPLAKVRGRLLHSTALSTVQACASHPSRPFDPTVYFVADSSAGAGLDVPSIAAAAVRGGARVVQFRDKEGGPETKGRATSLFNAVRAASEDVSFIVNDNANLAVEVGADGVHVGQEDASLTDARKIVGDDMVVGVSVGTIAEAEAAIAGGADYLGVGCVFETKSKTDAGEPLGLGKLAEIVRAVDKRVPVVAIGGINMGNCGGCAVVGCDGVAVIRTIMVSDDPEKETEMLYERFCIAHFDRPVGGQPVEKVELDLSSRATF